MLYSPESLLNQVVHPTLTELGIDNAELAISLTSIALLPQLPIANSFGIYQISCAQHRRVWDNQLARDPDLASRVRGLASQRRFLRNPDQELTLNPGYATAIALHLLIPEGDVLDPFSVRILHQRWCRLNRLPEQAIHRDIDRLRRQLDT